MAGLSLYLWVVSISTFERPFKTWIVITRRCCGMEVSRAWARFSAGAMTKSSGVTDRLVGYLCLKNEVLEIQVAWLPLIRISNTDSVL